MIKAITTDIDGTIIRTITNHYSNDNSTNISDYTKQTLSELKKNNVLITYNTGRALSSAIAGLGGEENIVGDYLIVCNGCLIYNLNTQKVEEINSLSKLTLASLLYTEKPEIKTFLSLGEELLYDSIPTDSRVCKLEIQYNDNIDLENKLNELKNQYSDYQFTIMQSSRSNKRWIEFSPANTSKSNALKEICKSKGIMQSEVIGFGDGLNDIDMLKSCGISVAVANALDEVKNNCKYVAPKTNDESGVADWINSHISFMGEDMAASSEMQL